MTLELTDLSRVLLLELFYTGSGGTTVVERFCSASAPIEVDGFDYLPDPALTATLPDRTSILDEDDIEFRITNRWGSIRELAIGRAFAPVTANLLEAIISPDAATLGEIELLHLASGRVALIQENLEGEMGVSALTIRNAKNDLEYPLDNIAVDTCRNDFGSDKTCLFDIEAAMETGVITSISGITVTLTGLPVVPLYWWERGFIRALGVDIAVRSWKTGTTFKLNQLPPRSWLDALLVGPGFSLPVEVRPGCARNLSACRVRGREASFRALGFNVPFFHPNFEKPE